MHPFTNKLISETSPYLLQHAHNPVNWFPWGDEALDLAKKENKPILVSIGYSACHWCHVMERESFEDEETAKLMNDFFINIKIDREERPDLDHIYMDAVQAMTGSGGWPLNVFLTPEGKPFYGGTYFPPSRAFNRPSWKEILINIHEAFNNRRNEIDAQAENLTEHLIASNNFGVNTTDDNALFTKTKTDEIFTQIMKHADKTWGGFGRAPKFPQTFVIQYLLRYYYVTKSDEALKQAVLSIDKMINGGIYDHIGGGFARYSTDTEWLVPHFEKMLYDNALLLSVISEAFQVTKNKRYAEVIDETVSFLIREMPGSNGGYYSALDADSEGEEGKFYVWNREEVEELLKEDADIFCSFFDINENGNWEGKNIPWRKLSREDFCKVNNVEIEVLDNAIITGKNILLKKRQDRIRPGTDDKLLLSWNALLCVAFCKSYRSIGNKKYKELAIKLIAFLESAFYDKKRDVYFHSFKNGICKQPAFLDDLAYLAQTMIHIQEITGEINYLLKARQICEHVIAEFSDESNIFFYFTSINQSDVIIRKKEIYDGAQPSGNAIMADNLYRLAIYFDIPAWRDRAQKMLENLGKALVNYPTSFALWCNLTQEIVDGTNELVLISEDWKKILSQLNNEYIPHRVLMSSPESVQEFPLLSGKQFSGKTTIFLCRNYTCDTPVSSVSELMDRIGHK